MRAQWHAENRQLEALGTPVRFSDQDGGGPQENSLINDMQGGGPYRPSITEN